MPVVSTGPLPVTSLLWQARPSTWMLTIVCKATFTLTPMVSPLAPVQEPIWEEDVYRDNDPTRSLLHASDLAPMKQNADVVLVGHAYAPDVNGVRSLVARLVVGDIDKPIQVYCDRTITQQGKLRDGQRFTRMALDYERAAGGPDTWNPVGIRRDVPDELGRTTIPNLLPVGEALPESIPAIGFGPIAPTWPLRREKLGPHEATWTPATLRSEPLPVDLDRSFFNIAPADQRVPELRENERIVLENLHPDRPRLATNLPGLRPRATLLGRPGGPRDIPMRFDTLVIDTDRFLCIATYRGQLALAHADEPYDVHVTMGESDKPSAAPLKPQPSLGTATMAIDMSQPLFDGSLGPTIPFLSAAKAFSAKTPPHSMGVASVEIDMTAFADLPLAPAPNVRPPARPASVPPPRPTQPTLPSAPPIAPPPHAAPAMVFVPSEFSPSTVGPSSPWAAGAPIPGSLSGPPQTIGEKFAASIPLAGPSSEDTTTLPSIETLEPMTQLEARPDALVLVWFDQKMVPRIVRKPAWQRFLDDMENEPIDPEADDSALSDNPAEIENRAQVFEILDRASATDVEGVHLTLFRAVGKRGKLIPPLELVDGELAMVFDQVETLKSLVATTTPLVTGDDPLAEILATAEKFLATSGASSAPAVADGLSKRIRDVLAQGKRAKMKDGIDDQVERALLEQRHYQKRKVLGGTFLRGLLHTPGSPQPLVTYLPVAVADELPLSVKFRAKIIGIVHPSVDEREIEPAALQAVAVGRVVRIDAQIDRDGSTRTRSTP